MSATSSRFGAEAAKSRSRLLGACYGGVDGGRSPSESLLHLAFRASVLGCPLHCGTTGQNRGGVSHEGYQRSSDCRRSHAIRHDRAEPIRGSAEAEQIFGPHPAKRFVAKRFDVGCRLTTPAGSKQPRSREGQRPRLLTASGVAVSQLRAAENPDRDSQAVADSGQNGTFAALRRGLPRI